MTNAKQRLEIVVIVVGFMINKLICYFAGHNPTLWTQYENFIDEDGIMKVAIPKYTECRRCGIKLLRDGESFEWPLIASGHAVIRD